MLTRLHHFLQDRFTSFGQYLGAYIIALYTAIIRILYIYYEPASSALSEILLSCGFVFPLMVTISLISQIIWKKNYWNMVWYVIVWLIGIWFYSYILHLGVFNDDYSGMEQHRIFVVLSYIIARWSLLWWIAYSTYKTSLQTRWWLKELLINILIAIVSSLILRWWLSASIGSVDYLFDVDIYYKRYQYIGVISFCIVGVSIVLTNLATTKKVDDYTKILRFFGLYIFLPLAIVYAVILMSYGAKILITQTWPKWLISWMVIWYTIRCTIVYFLTYPLQNLTWIKNIHTWYFVSILVFLPLLIWAIRQRISQYGITEDRYLIVMIALWIAVVGLWSLIWRSKSWLLMIGWLLILAISSVYTPWSATSISLASQTYRLEQLLGEVNLRDWLKPTPHTINSNDFTSENIIWYNIGQAADIISYIARNHWINLLEKFYVGTWFNDISKNNTRGIEKIFLKNLWVTGYIIDQNAWISYTNNDEEIPFNIYYNKDIKSSQIALDWYTKVQFINSQSWTGYKIDLTSYGEQLYQLSINDNEVPLIRTDKSLIIVENLNGMKYKKTNTYRIDYYSLIIFTK